MSNPYADYDADKLPDDWFSGALQRGRELECKHGIRKPHECKECADEPSDDEVAEWMKENGLATHE